MELQGQTAIVTGAAQGIGRAIALTLAREGAVLALGDVNFSKAQEVAGEIAALGGRALACKVDVSSAEEAQGLIDSCLQLFGRVDILVNNAGVTRDGLVLRMKKEDWDLVLNINLTGAFLCSKAAARPMAKQRQGRIINIASVVGLMGNTGQANYAASKAGVIGLTKSLAKELASRSVTVNAIAPGFIDTDMTRVLPQEVKEAMLRQIPLGRWGTVQDVAHCVRFLASSGASYMTGQVISVNGGMYM